MTSPNESVACGLCKCGCGCKTKLAPYNSKSRGWEKGKPKDFLVGHSTRIRPTIEDAVPFKIDGVYCRLIPLTKGQWAIVCESDYHWLMHWKWQANWDQSIGGYYATRRELTKIGKRRMHIKMHRQILGLAEGDKNKGDHWNHVTLDNRRKNLRVVNNSKSTQNQKLRSDSLTGFKGVHLHRRTGKWQARIMINGVRQHLGLFITAEAAYAAYCDKALQHFGEFARLA